MSGASSPKDPIVISMCVSNCPDFINLLHYTPDVEVGIGSGGVSSNLTGQPAQLITSKVSVTVFRIHAIVSI